MASAWPRPADSERQIAALSTDTRTDTAILGRVRVIGDSCEDEMVACFLLGELTSRRFGGGIRRALVAAGESERLLTDADLADPVANRSRRDLLGVTRGYGENRGVFEGFQLAFVGSGRC